MTAYAGTELELFADAHNWKAYLFAQIEPHVRGRVLEVGAGIGGTTRVFARARHDDWLSVEPDPKLAAEIVKARDAGRLPASVRVCVGTTATLDAAARFDTALYIDVLEHLEDDRRELEAVCRKLAPGGTLAIAGPAMQWLYSPFDAAIGHYRRYTRGSLARAVPQGMERVRLRYLDCAGVALSLANRLLLRSAYPTSKQIAIWDRWVVPVSRLLDPLMGRWTGKSVLGIWRKPASAG